MSTQHGPRFAKETLQGRLTSQASCSQLHFYQMKYHTQRRQTTLAIIAIKTIELVSQSNWLADISVLVHPSREVRYDCSKPKGNTMLYHLPCVLEAHVLLWISFDRGCDLERERFSADIQLVSVSGSDVSGWDVMSKGGMEIWHPVGAPFG